MNTVPFPKQIEVSYEWTLGAPMMQWINRNVGTHLKERLRWTDPDIQSININTHSIIVDILGSTERHEKIIANITNTIREHTRHYNPVAG